MERTRKKEESKGKKERKEGREGRIERSGEEHAGVRNGKCLGPEVQTWLSHMTLLTLYILPPSLLSLLGLALVTPRSGSRWDVDLLLLL